MKKPVLVIVVIIVIVALGGGYYLVKNHGYKKPGSTGTNMNMSNTGTTSTPTATNAVAIENFAFSPTAITVKKGTTVTWTNKDSVAHTVTETDGQTGPSSANVDPGATYTFTFNTAGTYHYHCAIHSDMTGTVTVTE